jgi:hypothetical protein
VCHPEHHGQIADVVFYFLGDDGVRWFQIRLPTLGQNFNAIAQIVRHKKFARLNNERAASILPSSNCMTAIP